MRTLNIRTLAKQEVGYLLDGARTSTDLYGTGFDSTDEENDEAIATLRQRAWAALRAKVDEQTVNTAILTKLRSYFEKRFRYDERGVLRVWKPDDDIDGAFKEAKDVTLELVSLYAKIMPQDPKLVYTPPESGDDDVPGLVVFSETKALELDELFRREADAQYMEAKQRTVVGTAYIPYWVYIAFVILGRNEVMMVLSDRVYFAMVVVVAAIA